MNLITVFGGQHARVRLGVFEGALALEVGYVVRGGS
jgi:hypothetical protein